MNAKKIMGAVLVAFLAAALFIGAGAASDAKSVGTVFVYQETDLKGAWTGDAGSVTFVDGVVAGENIKAGVYTNDSGFSMYLCYPTAVISAIANNNSVKYPVVGGNLYEGTEELQISVVSPAGAMIDNILITYPDGTQKRVWDILGSDAAKPSNEGGILGNPNNFYDGNVTAVLDKDNMSEIFTETGTYKFQAIFNVSGAYNQPTAKPLVDWIPDKYLVAQDAYTITFVSEEQEVAISASVDKVLAGKTFTVTITGMPGNSYTIAGKDKDDNPVDALHFISAGAQTVDENGKFKMPNGGSITVYMNCTTAGKLTLSVAEDAEVTIEILKPTITATLGAPSYFIGDDIEVILSSDSEVGSGYKFNITGTNIVETDITPDVTTKNPEKKDGKLIYKLSTKDVKLDVGTYTITVIKDGVVATLPVALKQPFISIAEAPEVVVQNKSASFFINAEATDAIQAYIFGTNKFIAVFNGSIVNVDDEEDKPIDNLFNVTLNPETTKNMATGQYFAVFQHPMYDTFFNINATNAGAFYLSADATPTGAGNGQLLFNVSDRQTANAAQALCDALESQNIDDMYVKASFFVVSTVDKDSFSISEIPTTVAQGETITITGVDTASEEGTQVTVEMVSTAFAAVPKETVGSAAFILATTEIAEDGTWEITLDTTGLNIDEYTLAVKIANELKESVTVNVVEADEPVNPEQPEEPEQPEQPEEPVAPATPGFGALAALAGLGAVAVLLLRRE